MKRDLQENIKTLMNIENGSSIELVFDSLVDQAPIIGKVLSSHKIYRLGKRLESHEIKIAELSELAKQIEDQEYASFIKETVFPALLENLLSEDEDAKISLFLNGFSHTVNHRLFDKAELLIFQDILKELRYIDIERLIWLSRGYKEYRFDQRSKGIEEDILGIESYVKKGKESRDVLNTINNKLERFGLIDTGIDDQIKDLTKMIESINKFKSSGPRRRSTSLTSFGKRFILFFNLSEVYKDK